jgi:hypothetical protein
MIGGCENLALAILIFQAFNYFRVMQEAWRFFYNLSTFEVLKINPGEST